MQSNYLTVPEFAEKAHVTVQAVYKKLRNNKDFQEYSTVVNGVKVIYTAALQKFYGIEPEPETEEPQDNYMTDLIQLLKEQLQAKDKQIEDLTEALLNSQKLQAATAARLALLEDKQQDSKGQQDSPSEHIVEPSIEPSEPSVEPTVQTSSSSLWGRFKKALRRS